MTYITPSTMTQATPAAHWLAEVRGVTDDARRILDRITKAQRIARANRIADLVAATPDGVALPGTTVGRQEAEALLATTAAVAQFLEQEVSDGVTISDVLYAMWPVIEPEE